MTNLRAAALAGALAACASPTTSTIVESTSIALPLHVAGGRLVDANGNHVYVSGDTAWSFVAALSDEDASTYLADRQGRGVNAMNVNLIEHKFALAPPADIYGNQPFTTPGDFSTPNPAYFAHAHAKVAAANAAGVIVFLLPAYLGFPGTDEGWFQEMGAQAPGACASYGTFVANLFADLPNVVWTMGGDQDPTGQPYDACHQAMANAIHAAAPSALVSGHYSNDSSTWTYAPLHAIDGLDAIDSKGTSEIVAPLCASARSASGLPSFDMENDYENDAGIGVFPNGQQIRRQLWESALYCGGGNFYGNGYIWEFAASPMDWRAHLDDPGIHGQTTLVGIVTSRPWWSLTPDPQSRQLVTSGGGSWGTTAWVSAAWAPAVALVYVPQAAGASIKLNMARFSSPMAAKWVDPKTGAATTVTGSPFANSGTVTFARPTALNSDGFKDWVLTLDATSAPDAGVIVADARAADARLPADAPPPADARLPPDAPPPPAFARIAFGGQDGAGPWTTGAVTPAPGQLLLASVTVGSASTSPAPPVVTGAGLTWTLVASTPSLGDSTLAVYRAAGAAGTPGALTITRAGSGPVPNYAEWAIYRANGFGSVVQSATAATTSAHPSAALAAAPQPGHLVAALWQFGSTVTVAATAGFAKIDASSPANTGDVLYAETGAAPTSSPQASASTRARGVVVEIAP